MRISEVKAKSALDCGLVFQTLSEMFTDLWEAQGNAQMYFFVLACNCSQNTF